MSIPSLSSISTLNLWLDATDLNSMVFDPIYNLSRTPVAVGIYNLLYFNNNINVSTTLTVGSGPVYFGYYLPDSPYTDGQLVQFTDQNSTLIYTGSLSLLIAGGFGYAYGLSTITSVFGFSSSSTSTSWILSLPVIPNTITPALLQWNDKSPNRYQFLPIRPDDRPKISTNAILFDQVSSFHLVSRQKIPAASTLDFFAVVTPYSLWGPRAPLFDSADITVAETDTRFNVQVYADGNEFGFRGAVTQDCNNAAAIYKGDLYIGTYAAVGPGPAGSNFLQKYNRTTRVFEYVRVPMRLLYTHALTVFDGKLYAAGGQMINYNSGGNGGQGVGPAEIWDGVNTRFLSTSFISTFPSALTVHKRQLFAFTTSGWAGLYFNNNATTNIATQNKPQMYVLNPLTNNFRLVADTQSSYNTGNNNGADLTVFTSNAISFRGDLFISGGCNNSYGRTLTRYTNENVYASNNLSGSIYGYLSIFLGSLIVPFTADTRIFKYNESAFETMGRWNPLAANGQTWIASGGMTTYKGKLHGIFSGSNNTVFSGSSNWIQVFSGDPGSMYSNSVSGYSNLTSAFLTTNVTGTTNCNLMIIHDGKLFVQNGFNNPRNIIEFGNGISMDQSFSTLVAAPILVNVRKTPNSTQLYLNGTLVQSQTVNFTYANQSNREMWIGGAAGLMQSGLSDSGSDHFQGAIHAVAQYSSNLSVGDRQRVEGILAWTFGIQNVRPASHPFRNSSP